MTTNRISWSGGIQGGPKIDGEPTASLHELLTLIRERGNELDERTAQIMGGVALFLAIRDFGNARSSSVLHQSEKALDSFYPVFRDAVVDRAFQQGMTELRDHVFPYRASPYNEVLRVAFDWIENKCDAA